MANLKMAFKLIEPPYTFFVWYVNVVISVLWFLVFRIRSCCYVTACKMKRSVMNSDLSEAKARQKQGIIMDSDREDLGDR